MINVIIMRFKNSAQRRAVFYNLKIRGLLRRPKLGKFKNRFGGKRSDWPRMSLFESRDKLRRKYGGKTFAERERRLMFAKYGPAERARAISTKQFRKEQQEERSELQPKEQEVYNPSTGQWEKKSVIF